MRFGLGLGLVLLLLSTQSTVHAEGSAEFDIGDVAFTHNPHDQAVSTPTQMLVDINDGTNEKICWRGTGSLGVFRPAPNQATVVNAAVANNSCVNGVNGVNGAYRLVLNSNQVMGTEWDVRVCDKAVTNANCFGAANANERLGRLWSYTWIFQQNGGNYAASASVNGSVYAIVPGGDMGRDAVIEMQMRGVSGAFYNLFANGIGPETNTGARIGRSVNRTGNRVTPTLPLYLNPPGVALYNWVTPTITDVQLTTACSSGVVLGSSPGSISFTTNVTGQYVVVCDVNKDGVYNFAGATDFSSFGPTVIGANTVVWNGTDNAGVSAAPGNYSCIVRVNVGEFHYVAEDIETAFPGIRMYRINNDRTTRTPINMFWDDTGVPADNENMPAPISALSPNSAPAAGLAPGAYGTAASAFRLVGGVPTGNARGWGNFDADGKGNNNFLDQFSAADTAQSPPFTVSVFANGGDQDGDGLTNARECAIGSNPEDVDSDNDGVNDGFEATGTTAPDSDNDGTIDALDTDDDGDGIPTSVEIGTMENGDGNPSDSANSDATGPADYLDVDSDNDGVCDGVAAVSPICVAGPDLDRTDPLSCRDTDNDNCDDCANTGSNQSGGNPNADGTDTDTDGACNLTDPDDDNDGVCDSGVAVANVCVAGPDTNPLSPNACSDSDGDSCDDCSAGAGAAPLNDGTDTDGDGACNVGDPDDDDDGVCDGGTAVANVCVAGPDSAPINPNVCSDRDADTCEDCVNGSFAPNNDGTDTNNDGICDAGQPDADTDDDGVCDSGVAVPNVCVAGPDSAPTDPNVCLDSDSDNCDDCVVGSYAPNNDGTDTDRDGLCDVGDPIVETDTDGDGIADAVDLDDDNDGIIDSDEDTDGVDTDTDGDGVPNRLDLDSDNDGIADLFESGAFDLDADSDDMVDGPFGANGFADALESTVDSGTSALLPIDTDGDGDEDFVDLDSDADGFFDIEEVSALAGFDSDNDGMLDNNPGTTSDPRADDADSDGIPQAYDVEDVGPGSGDSDDDGETDFGECPNGWPCPDSDGDAQPNYTEPVAAMPPLDTDADGVLDTVECPAMPCRDTDGDGTADYLDPDDDDDGLPTIEERPGNMDVDSDGDGTPDFLDADDDDDGVPTVDERPDDVDVDTDGDGIPDHLDTDDDDDGVPTIDEPTDDDGDGVPDRLEPPRTGTLAGGALCTVAAVGATGGHGYGLALATWLFALGGLGYAFRRRGRGGPRKKVPGAAVVAALLALWFGASGVAAVASAQVAVDQLKPAVLPSDGFGLSRPDTLGEMQWAAMMMLDYANDPLVYELTSPDEERKVVKDHLVLHAALGLGVTDRITLFATLPVHLMMRGNGSGGLAPAADGAGLGDVALGGRFWFVGEADGVVALSGELIARLPTASLAASNQTYAGDRVGSYEPAFVAELRGGPIAFTVRPGLRFRQQRTISNLRLGSEFVYGAALRLTLADGVYSHTELFGAAMLTKFGDREQTPLELLTGFKFALSDWHVGLAAGPGLSHGYGAPDLRAVLSLSHSPTEAPPVEVVPELPGDTDGDGLLDPDDRCPRRAEDKDDFQDDDGCPDPDNDQDRVMDVDDECVMEPEDRDRFEDIEGCPDPDNDQDGILDADDRCPLEPEDVDHYEDDDGCPDPDNDGDTVLDVNDDCPLVPGSPDARGCVKEALVEIEGSQIMVLERVEFATNKDVILEKSMPIMEAVERTISANSQLTLIRIEGHTDDVGRDRRNMKLSQRRARSVARWLIDHGIDASRLEAYGCGENRPLEPNTDAETRQQNRRVEFHIVRPSTGQPRSTGGCRSIAID